MADKKITDFPEISSIGANDVFLVGGTNATYKAKLAAIKNSIRAVAVGAETSDATIQQSENLHFPIQIWVNGEAGHYTFSIGENGHMFLHDNDQQQDVWSIPWPLDIPHGGTGATTAEGARANLGTVTEKDILTKSFVQDFTIPYFYTGLYINTVGQQESDIGIPISSWFYVLSFSKHDRGGWAHQIFFEMGGESRIYHRISSDSAWGSFEPIPVMHSMVLQSQTTNGDGNLQITGLNTNRHTVISARTNGSILLPFEYNTNWFVHMANSSNLSAMANTTINLTVDYISK